MGTYVAMLHQLSQISLLRHLNYQEAILSTFTNQVLVNLLPLHQSVNIMELYSLQFLRDDIFPLCFLNYMHFTIPSLHFVQPKRMFKFKEKKI